MSDAEQVDGEVAAFLEEMAMLVVRHLTPREMSFTSAATLSRLARLGPLRLTALASGEGVSQPSMTQLVQRLERQGLVRRTADPADGRVVLVAVTDAGRRVLAERRQARGERLVGLLAQLPSEDREALRAAAHTAQPALRHLVEAAARGDLGERAEPTA